MDTYNISSRGSYLSPEYRMFQHIEYKERMMLHFKGSDCRRSLSSTWYNMMDNLLMGLGFNESKVDSNLYFKFEGGIPMMLLIYIYDLFLTR